MPLVCIVPIALLVGFVILIVVGLMGAIKSSDSYKIPVATATVDSRVISAIGTPIKVGFLVTGNINVQNTANMSSSTSSGRADLAIPISGPKGQGTIYVNAVKAGGTWTFSNMLFKMDGTTIDLNAPKKDNGVKSGVAPKQLESNQL
ncbi:MAG: Fungal protein of unknown function [Pedosphaera sp.]|nr:Fungal protein of unknown function [Pedosphaera sp.]